ncbi:MAG: urease subunit gamma [Anaerovoracaceae bacterium]|jgi:urease subunit gamma|nr:urease subunit gamma [Clostridiales bacterium]
MRLTQKELERLIIFEIAEISRRRLKRKIKLNYIEAEAIICDELLERAREGKHTISQLVELGGKIISKEDVLEGTPQLLPMIQLEALFPDGNKLITIHNPIRLETRAETVKELVSFPSNKEGWL